MSADDVAIEIVHDLDAAWEDLARLFRGIVAYHAPFTGESLQAGWEVSWRAQIGREGSLVLIAREATGRAIAFAVAADRRNPVVGIDAGFVDTVYVEEPWRRQGVGRRLLEAIEGWCRERGLRRLDLSVRTANRAGIAAWRALGFADESLRLKKMLD